MPYPLWSYYPSREKPPAWVTQLVAAVKHVKGNIDSESVSGLTSDKVLAALRPQLEHWK